MPKRVLTGTVVSDKADKTIVVRVERRVKHPLYGKIVRRSKKYHAHDEGNAFRVGQVVRIEETRPISRLKTWTVLGTGDDASSRSMPAPPVEALAVEDTGRPAPLRKAEKPAEEIGADLPPEAPDEKPAEEPAEKPAATPRAKTADKPAKDAEKPAKAAEKPAKAKDKAAAKPEPKAAPKKAAAKGKGKKA